MKIAPNKVIVMHYAVSDNEDTLIDSSYDHKPLSVIHGTGFLIPGLEDALIDHVAGDQFEVSVSAEQAYGKSFEEYVQTMPKNLFAGIEDLAVGSQLRATTDDGEQTVIVIDVQDSKTRILHISAEIHPDVKFLRSLLTTDVSIELQTLTWLGGNNFVEKKLPGTERSRPDSRWDAAKIRQLLSCHSK